MSNSDDKTIWQHMMSDDFMEPSDVEYLESFMEEYGEKLNSRFTDASQPYGRDSKIAECINKLNQNGYHGDKVSWIMDLLKTQIALVKPEFPKRDLLQDTSDDFSTLYNMLIHLIRQYLIGNIQNVKIYPNVLSKTGDLV